MKTLKWLFLTIIAGLLLSCSITAASIDPLLALCFGLAAFMLTMIVIMPDMSAWWTSVTTPPYRFPTRDELSELN